MKHTKESELIALLWDYLKKDPEHKDRRRTGWGTKTQHGLIASIERIVGPDLDAVKELVEAAEAISKYAALANEIQRNKVEVSASVWSELYHATNQMRAALKNLKGE